MTDIILDMLGDPLRDAIVGARSRLTDDTITASIYEGLVIVVRGGLQVGDPMGYDDGVAFVAGMA